MGDSTERAAVASPGATRRVASPQDTTAAVRASRLHAPRGKNTSVRSFSADNVFNDSVQYQTCGVVADASSGGHHGSLVVGIVA